MHFVLKMQRASAMVLALCLLAVPVPFASGAAAEVTTSHIVSAEAQKQRGATRYVVDFRSRYALSYGHTFVMFGRTDAQGRFLDREVAGLHPATDSPVPWMIGHVVPVPSETGPSDGDLEDEYLSASFRVELSEAQYKDVVAFIRQLQERSPLWHATFYNCNAFVADIAQYMGLKTPHSTLLYPDKYINALRERNVGKASASIGG